MPTPRCHRHARADLEALWQYLAQYNIQAADQYLEGLHEAAHLHAANPGMGRLEAELAERLEASSSTPLRSFLYRNHRCYYLPDEDGIFILRVLDVRRDIDTALGA
jgi:plasmid stabilization system protein ParE